jgi:hypothetical protein
MERMMTMIDEIFDRTYQNGRADLHRGVEELFGAIARQVDESLTTLHDLQWSAPWAARAATPKDAGCA